MGLHLTISDHSSDHSGGCNGCNDHKIDLETARTPAYTVRWLGFSGIRVRLCRECWNELIRRLAEHPEPAP